ncbi:MAG: hypothetical protein LBS94_02225, partial [Prevotellaceae bacterium]|nr:hypothetical protein [Prevotellaceae bacterium]
MKKTVAYIALLVAACLPFATQAQEQLCAVAAHVAMPKATGAAEADTLLLPFFDDFSQTTSTAANPAWWLASGIFVNNTYARNQPTTGVATFDVLDAAGRVYPHVGRASTGADTLCSKPIRLNTADRNVFLSFVYQPRGAGDDLPEASDILELQFLNADSAWVPAWQSSVDTFRNERVLALKETNFLQTPATRIVADSLLDVTTTFTHVMLRVVDPQFLHSAFQLRFINNASRSQSDVAGQSGNCDIWNLDLVYLNRNRSAADTMLTDVAVALPVQRLLKDYQMMPWQHLRSSPTAQREQLVNAAGTGVGISFDVSNLGVNHTAFRTDFEVQCTKGASITSQKGYSGGTNNIQRDTTRTFTFNLPSSDFLNTPKANADSVEFTVKAIISDYAVDENLAPILVCNDTSSYRLQLFDSYAYDDGSAENGFGIYGASAANAKVAVRFFSYRRDTLSGVHLYFNSTQDSGNFRNVHFKLAVWGEADGQPAAELYSEANLSPRFDSLNRPVFYPLTHPLVVEGAFYVGWIQQSAAMLNVGFDRNNRPQNKMFVSEDSYSWRLSKFDGQGILMVRPSFARIKYEQPTAVGK